MAIIYNVEYSSENLYEDFVSEAIFEFLITPCNDHTQMLLNFHSKNSSSQDFFFSRNSYGFHTLRIRTQKPFTQFSFQFHARVEKEDERPYYKVLKEEEQVRTLHSLNFYIENFLYLTASPLTLLSEENRKQIVYHRRGDNLLEFLEKLNSATHSMIQYEANITTVDTTANDVLKIRKGVCQDYTHLFIAMARANRIPARYVSGYLDQGENYIGASMMHAWAEVLVPGTGWVGYDPTNNKLANSHYIKVCHGMDYSDCSPLKGVLLTKGGNTTNHQVKVAQQ